MKLLTKFEANWKHLNLVLYLIGSLKCCRSTLFIYRGSLRIQTWLISPWQFFGGFMGYYQHFYFSVRRNNFWTCNLNWIWIQVALSIQNIMTGHFINEKHCSLITGVLQLYVYFCIHKIMQFQYKLCGKNFIICF